MLISGLTNVFIILEDDDTYRVCFRTECNDELRIRTVDSKITDPAVAQRIKKAYIFGVYDVIAKCVDNTKDKNEVVP